MTRGSDKQRKLKLLARKRQRSRWKGYHCISDYHDGIYECDHVSPYTKSAGNVDSEIMVMLQDWSSDDALGQKAIHYDCVCCGYGKKVRTNGKLIELLKRYFAVDLKDIFATNLFPFIKRGQLGAPIAFDDLVCAATEFAIPQIEILRPRLVICLGLDTFNALRSASSKDTISQMDEAIRNPFRLGKATIWCQAHTGYWGQINRNKGRRRVPSDWNRMKRWFESVDGSKNSRASKLVRTT
jgi:hypothetical protein